MISLAKRMLPAPRKTIFVALIVLSFFLSTHASPPLASAPFFFTISPGGSVGCTRLSVRRFSTQLPCLGELFELIDRRSPIPHLQFPEDVLDVFVDSTLCKQKRLGDLPILRPLPNQMQDLLFA
jgi:hypothetical protein